MSDTEYFSTVFEKEKQSLFIPYLFMEEILPEFINFLKLNVERKYVIDNFYDEQFSLLKEFSKIDIHDDELILEKGWEIIKMFCCDKFLEIDRERRITILRTIRTYTRGLLKKM